MEALSHGRRVNPQGESARFLARFLQQNPVCFYWMDAEGNIDHASEACATLTQGLPLEAFFAQLASDPVNQRGFQCAPEQEQRGAGEHEPSLLHWVDPQGQERWVLHACWPDQGEDRERRGWFGLLLEIGLQPGTFEQTQRSRSQAYALYQVLEKLNQASSLEEVYSVAVEGVLQVMRSHRSALLLFGPDKRPHFVAWRNLSERYRSQVDGHSPWPMEQLDAQPLWYEDVQQSKDFSPRWQRIFQDEGIRALAFIPLVGRYHLLGKFMVYYNTPHVFTEEERRLAQILASYLTAAVSRLRAWQALADSEARLKGLINATPDVILFKDMEGRWLEANQAALELFGLLGVDYRGKSDAELAQMAQCTFDEPSLFEQCQRLREKAAFDEVWRQEVSLADAQGQRYVFDVLRVPVRDAQGTPKGVVIMARDITERKLAEKALQESEARFRALAESTLAGIYVLIGERFVYVNRAWENLTGYSAAELSQMSLWDIVHPDSQDVVRQSLQAEEAGASERYEMQIVCKDGQTRWVIVGGALISWEDQPAILASAVDITEHKRYEQTLEAEIRLIQHLGEVPESGLAPLWEQMLEAVQRVIPQADRAALLLLNDQGQLCVQAVRGYQESEILGICVDDSGPAALIFQRRQPFLVHDVRRVPGIEHLQDQWRARSAVVAPLRVRDALLGILVLDSVQQSHAFDENDLRILDHFASTATLLLEDARLVENLRQRLLEMESVHRVTKVLREAGNATEALRLLLKETLRVVGSEVGAIMLYDPEENLLRKAVAQGWLDKFDAPLKPGEGIGGTVFLQNRPHFSEDFSQDPLAHPERRAWVPSGWGGACFPLHTADEVLGVMFVALPPGQQFAEPQRYLLETLAEIGGVTLHRIRLY